MNQKLTDKILEGVAVVFVVLLFGIIASTIGCSTVIQIANNRTSGASAAEESESLSEASAQGGAGFGLGDSAIDSIPNLGLSPLPNE